MYNVLRRTHCYISQKVLEKEKILFSENLCLTIKTHRMRENWKHMWIYLQKGGEKYASETHVWSFTYKFWLKLNFFHLLN